MSCTRVTHLGTVYFVLEVFQVAQVLDHTSPCFREHKSSVHAHPAPGSLAQHIWAVPPNPEHPEQHRALLKPSQIFSPNCREPVLNPRFAFLCINSVMWLWLERNPPVPHRATCLPEYGLSGRAGLMTQSPKRHQGMAFKASGGQHEASKRAGNFTCCAPQPRGLGSVGALRCFEAPGCLFAL